MLEKFVHDISKDKELQKRYYFYTNLKNSRFQTINEAHEFLDSNIALLKGIKSLPKEKLGGLKKLISEKYTSTDELNDKISFICENTQPSLAKITKFNGLKNDLLSILLIIPKNDVENVDKPESDGSNIDNKEYDPETEDDDITSDELASVANKKLDSELPNEEKKELQELFCSKGNKKVIYESYKSRALTKLQELQTTEKDNHYLTESIKKVKGMTFTEDKYLDDIIDLAGLLE